MTLVDTAPERLKCGTDVPRSVAEQLRQVDTLFIHEDDGDYRVAVIQQGERRFSGRLEVIARAAGPRPGRFLERHESGETPRRPEAFVELARNADAIRISEQTSRAGRAEIRELLDAYQLTATVVRTCRYCASAGEYSPIATDTAIRSGEDLICRECARRELAGEARHRGALTGDALERLTELLFDVGDLDRIVGLLQGGMDPELTRVDVISSTVAAVDPVRTDSLDIDARLRAVVEDRFTELLPVQSLSVREGLLEGENQLVVSATATGKTLIGEMAGIDRALRGQGTLVFLVPLVALANQTYRDFQEDYGHLVDITLRVGASRIRGGDRRFDPNADVIVGTYEGIDHALRTGRELGEIATVVIDEVHTLTAEERGHRLDGLIARLHEYCKQRKHETQWLYLSATVGNPEWLGERLGARVIVFEDRPVPIERHVTFADEFDKPALCDRLVKRAFDQRSSKGFRGQSIVFTNSRRRCHELARRITYDAAPYHAGLDSRQRASVEERFADGELAAVVTTAALGAGVDFPASQVIFERLAMGIEWLTVQEFEQMLGRAGRPDYHDRGTVYLLVEPGGQYHGGMERTEDEVAFALLKGETEDVRSTYDGDAAIEETLANIVVGGARAKAITQGMIGEVPMTWAVGKLLEYEWIDGLEPTPMGRVVSAHFLSPNEVFLLQEGVRTGADPFETVATVLLETADD